VALRLSHLRSRSDGAGVEGWRSGGDPILIPDHRTAAILGPALHRVAGAFSTGPERILSLAGPGLPAAEGDLALVPEHPQTGATWLLTRPVQPIPPAWSLWWHLAFHRAPKPVGRSAPVPPEALPALLPRSRFEPDDRIFRTVLARLPEAGQPWPRAVHDRGLRPA
jgi:hypothetical protein